ncbi:hypothetical protein DL93DRAFT_2084806 [Clavulina sp. PMI_390]|nr:hypothetical protein DL93DRAFT_2084806 [Clavulina sp. PMI_390]
MSDLNVPDLAGLAINDNAYDNPAMNKNNNNSNSGSGASPAFFSTAPPGSAPFGHVGHGHGGHHLAGGNSLLPGGGMGGGGYAGEHGLSPGGGGGGANGAHFNNTIASLSAKPRGGLPSHWLDQSSSAQQDLGPGRSSPPGDLSLSTSSGSPPPSMAGSSMLSPQGIIPATSPAPTSGTGIGDDDIIPTAIVIKNIPFSVKKETLLQIIESLSIPTPYAFNYHVDTAGQFRGLAFANFRLPQDADAVVAALNGFDVQGRKLRVEYKKVLQAGEKERIERDKAIRRMRSMQMEKERLAQQQAQSQGMGGGDWEDYGQVQPSQYGGGFGMGHPSPGMSHASPARSYSNGGYQQPGLPSVPPVPQIPQHYLGRSTSSHQVPPIVNVTSGSPPPLPHVDGLGALDGYQRSFSPPSQHSVSPPPMMSRGYSGQADLQQSLMQQSQPQQQQSDPAPAPSVAPSTTSATTSSSKYHSNELDMNDPSTLEIYSRILLFKDDRMRDELAFSRTLTALERRVVHMVAKKLGLYHRSVGEGSERFAVVMRNPPPPAGSERPPPPARSASGHHTLTRAQSSYLASSQGPPATPSPNRMMPPSHSALRAKKSMPDLGPHQAATMSGRLGSKTSSGNLAGSGVRDGYATISGAASRRGGGGHAGFAGLFGNPNGSSGGVNEDGTIPAVPPLPNSLASPSGELGGSIASGVVRQPRGPSNEGGFGGRFGSVNANSMKEIAAALKEDA